MCATLAILLTGRYGWSRETGSTLATLSAGAIGFAVLLRTCLPLNGRRAALLAAVAAAFTLAVIIAGPIFKLVPLDGKAMTVFVLLAAAGCAIVAISGLILQRRRKASR